MLERIFKRRDREDIVLEKCVARNRYLLVFDVIFMFIAYLLSSEMVLGTKAFAVMLETELLNVFLPLNLLAAFVYVAVLYIFNAYRIMWVFGTARDYMKMSWLCVIAFCINVFLSAAFIGTEHIRVILCASIFECIGIIGSRLFARAIYSYYRERKTQKKVDGCNLKRVVIIGAGNAATILLKDIRENNTLNYNVIGLIDDDPAKQRMKINGKQVLGTREDIERICKKYDIENIIIAMPSIPQRVIREICEVCERTNCKVKIIPAIDSLVKGKNVDLQKMVRDVNIEDLLARDTVLLDNDEIKNYISDRVVLVTGGGGSIGSELCRQIMRFNPEKLVIVDIYENNAYDIQMELGREYPENKPDVIIASVRDSGRLDDIFNEYRPYIVFHAAAHKHVPLMEDSPGEAIKNNVFGTLNTARCADKYGVNKFVLISSDKAVNPTNVMGATKRICEMIVQCMQKNSNTTYVAVRFGNVLGSNGSVIPLFKKQIASGGPVTVTDKRITRFFMTIPEAAQLVLQAASYAKGGEIFVLDMGEPVKIYDLAKNLISLSGMVLDRDIKIEVVGLRPGEKLYEELLMDEEGLEKTKHSKIFIGKPIDITNEKLESMLERLEDAQVSDDAEHIKDVIEDVVPTYKRNEEKVKS